MVQFRKTLHQVGTADSPDAGLERCPARVFGQFDFLKSFSQDSFKYLTNLAWLSVADSGDMNPIGHCVVSVVRSCQRSRAFSYRSARYYTVRKWSHAQYAFSAGQSPRFTENLVSMVLEFATAR